jgi:CCR4-NOT transcription complex subunit 1
MGIREILIEAFEQGRLLVAVSFVCKILEQSSRSKIFKPPNPWLMAQLRLLVELYHYAELRTGLKFEIEILLKALKLELRDIEASNLLKDRQKGVAPTLTPVQPSAGKIQPSEVSYSSQAQNVPLEGSQISSSSVASQQGKGADAGANSLSGVVHHITSIVSSPLFLQQPALKRFIATSIDRAIRDLFQAVVERSAKIACITTREMILKDFAMEPDEQKMRNAANTMVQNLASHLALVASKDPLRLTIGNYLRTFLQSHSSDHAIIEQAVQTVCDEVNVSALCTFFENASSEKGSFPFPFPFPFLFFPFLLVFLACHNFLLSLSLFLQPRGRSMRSSPLLI